MPKLKNRSAAKKRFKVTANGKVLHGQAGKNHFMRHKTKKQSRQLRGTVASTNQHAINIIKYALPIR